MEKNVEQIVSEIDFKIKKNKDFEYQWQISHAKSNDHDWTRVLEMTDKGSFTRTVEQIIEKFDTDALKIELSMLPPGYKTRKTMEPYYVRLTDTFINVLDEKGQEQQQTVSLEKTLAFTHDELNGLIEKRSEEKAKTMQSSLLGEIHEKFSTLEKQREQERFDAEKREINMRNDYLVKELRGQIDNLTQKNKDLEKELDDVSGYADEIESQLKETAGSSGLIETILSGISMLKGGAGDPSALAGTPAAPVENLTPEQQKRAESNTKIFNWLTNMDPINYRKFAEIALSIDKYPEVMDDIIELIDQLLLPKQEGV